ncbi:hypothetical protein J4406_02705 [Candidatus Woesearchaeota archaeon]|nr:hypothetical protein [Candidatus Woesearchaeota archaeon]
MTYTVKYYSKSSIGNGRKSRVGSFNVGTKNIHKASRLAAGKLEEIFIRVNIDCYEVYKVEITNSERNCVIYDDGKWLIDKETGKPLPLEQRA